MILNQQSSYRQIMKATSLFGGVQVFQIIIQIIRSKFIALLLGPTGMGIVGLLTSTIGLIGGLTNCGLGTSAVKNIAEANGTGDKTRIATVIKVMRRLIWITGLMGVIVTIIASPWLSQLTFGNRNYTFAFVWISSTMLFNQLSSGELVVLQGMRKLQHLAKANLLGSVLGLIITIPCYYKFRINGIVPGIIVSSMTTMLFSWFYCRKIDIKDITVSKGRTFSEGKNMLNMGFLISLSGLISIGASYLVRIFISRSGSIADVGLYNAGFAIINTYVGLIFTAMSTDYYPRLSAIAHDNLLSKEIINQQAEIAILILAPILCIFLVFINWIVVLLYSNQFLAVNGMIYWAALGMFFKVVSWALGFIFLAKGTSKIFFWSELVGNVYILIFNILGYHYWGLSGLGASFMLGYLFYLIQVYVIAKIKYNFSYDFSLIKIFISQFLLASASFFVVILLKQPYPYLIGMFLILISLRYSIKELDKRLDIKSIISNFIKRKY